MRCLSVFLLLVGPALIADDRLDRAKLVGTWESAGNNGKTAETWVIETEDNLWRLKHTGSDGKMVRWTVW